MKNYFPGNNAKRLALFLMTMLFVMTIYAVPAKPGQTRRITLSDGTTVNATLVGDEHGHFWQATDGKAYQAVGSKGYFQAIDRKALLERASMRRTAINRQRVKRMPGRRNVGEVGGITGQKKGLIILVNFSDKSFQNGNDNALYQNIANKKNFSEGNFKGSMHDYFYDQSQGKFELTFDVVGPVTVSKEQSYYGSNDKDDNDMHPAEMVIEALKLADSQVNYANYDWDGNGTVEQVYVVYAGMGEADGGDDSTIWPHEYTLSYAKYYGDGEGKQKLDGVFIDTYACGAELNGNGVIAGIGTMCHEFSHCLGYPDFYDTDYSGGQGMGYWDLMDGGSYNDDGYRPAGYTSYERWVAGWETPTELITTQSISNMQALQNGGGSYIIYNKGNRNEYFLLENRQKTKWDTDIPGSGLLILHVDYDANAWANNQPNDTPSHQRMTWIAADNSYQYSMYQGSKYYTFGGMANDPYPYGTNNSFSKTSTPAATLYNYNIDDTKYLDSSVEEITQNSDGTVSFQFIGIDDVTTLPSETIDFNEQGYKNQTVVTSVSGTDCTVTFDKGTNSSMPTYYTSGYAVRLYSGNKMTVASTTRSIVKIKLTFGSGENTNKITTDVGTFDEDLWTGSASSVTFTIDGNSGQRRIMRLTVTYAASTDNDPAASHGNVYKLVTDASTLAADDEILIAVNGDIAKAMSATQNTNNRPAVDVTKNQDGTLTPGEDAQIITLEKDGDNFLFNVGSGYLYAASSEKNYLKTETEADANAKATISISYGEATIAFQGSNTHNLMRYNLNNGSPIFSCYASNTTIKTLPQIYRKVPDVSVTISKVGYSTLYYSDKNLLVPQGVEAYTYSFDNGVLQHKPVDGVIAKGTAVVLKDTRADYQSSHSYRFAVVNTGTAVAGNCLYGYDEATTTNVPGGDYKYYMLSLNADSELSSVGFYYGEADGAPFTCGAHKAFLALPRSQSSNVMAYLFDGSVITDNTSSIDEILNCNTSKSECFDLQGRRVVNSSLFTHPSSLKKGIYVVGGRKVIVR